MSQSEPYKTVMPRSVFLACNWVRGRYEWEQLSDFVEYDSLNFEISRKEAIRLYKDLCDEGKPSYPCAGKEVIDFIQEIWNHFDLPSEGM